MKLISNKTYNDLMKDLPELIRVAKPDNLKSANAIRRCKLVLLKLYKNANHIANLP